MYTIHESEIEAKKLTGRDHKMIIGPDSALKAKTMCGGIADFPPESLAPAHVHLLEEELIYIVSGYGQIFFDGVPEPVRPGTCVSVPPGVEHQINNQSKEVLRIAYVFSPPVVQGSYEKK